MLRKPFRLLRLCVCALMASRYAAARGTSGIGFDRFGRQLGLRLLMRGDRGGLGYLLTPVNIVRYFEFPFVLSCLPESFEQCLDVSSPRLFSLYVATKNHVANIVMINPDSKDVSRTTTIVSRLGINNISTYTAGVHTIPNRGEMYDCIWSISVVEHIYGEYDDQCAVKLMYDALAAGGRLILTIPVDRKYWIEYRDRDYYGTQPKESGAKYFFQRMYDKAAIWERILSPLGQEPIVVRWFGETLPGRFTEYEKRWMREGHNCTVKDPREITDHYREFSSWEEMPGRGVCGLMVQKTRF